MRRGLMVLFPHVQLGKTIVPILVILQHLRAACGQVSYAFADTASLRTAVTAYLADPASATATYGPISSWGVSAVTNMNGLFSGLTQFNADISSWDTSSVPDMGYMFTVRPCPALSLHSRGLPAACATDHPAPPSRLLAHMSFLLLCFPFLLGRARGRSTSR